MQKWSKKSFILWGLAVLLGSFAALLLSVTYHFFGLIENALQVGRIGMGDGILFPAVAFLSIFALFFLTNTFRKFDSFTHFFSTTHYYSGRKNILSSLIHGLSSFFLLLGKGVVGLEAIVLEWTSSLGIYLGVRFNLPNSFTKTLTVCALGASLAAIWKLPVVAILFVIELFYSWTILSTAIGPIILTAFVAASVSQGLAAVDFLVIPSGLGGGFFPLFQDGIGFSSLESLLYICIPIILATSFFAVILNWFLRATENSFHNLFEWKKVSLPVRSFVKLTLWAGVSTLIYWEVKEVSGLGTQLLQTSFLESLTWNAVLGLLLLRLILFAFSYAAIGSLGLIVPLFSLGILLAASLFHLLSAWADTSMLAFMLLTVSALYSASFGIPLAASAFVFYYSGASQGDNLVLFLFSIIINFLTYFISSYLYPYRLYSIGSHRMGIYLMKGLCFNMESAATVKDAMIRSDSISTKTSVSEAYNILLKSRFIKLPVLQNKNKLRGMLSLSNFLSLGAWGDEANSQIHDLVNVEELMQTISTVVYPDMSLKEAVFFMQDEELLPVVKRDTKDFLGVLLKSDLINLYNKEMLKIKKKI